MNGEVIEANGKIEELEAQNKELQEKCVDLEEQLEDANQQLEEKGSPVVSMSKASLGKLSSKRKAEIGIDQETQTDIGPDYFTKVEQALETIDPNLARKITEESSPDVSVKKSRIGGRVDSMISQEADESQLGNSPMRIGANLAN